MRVQEITTKFQGEAWVERAEIAETLTTAKVKFFVEYCADGRRIQTIAVGDTASEAISKARAKGF